MTSLTCTFCNKTFSGKQPLSIHQKRAKYCLEIQRQNTEEEIKDDLYECEYCGKKVSPFQVERHHGVCKAKIAHDLDVKNKAIEELKEKLIVPNTNTVETQTNDETDNIQELTNKIGSLETKLVTYKRYYHKYLKLYKQLKTELIQKDTNVVAVQTDDLVANSKKTRNIPDVVKDMQAELTKLKMIPSSSKTTKKTKETQARIKELEADLETYRNEVIAIETKNVYGDAALWIDGVTIEARASDGYINATQMCSSVKTIHGNDKEIKHWRANASTKAFLLELASDVGIPTSDLVLVGKSTFKAGGEEVEVTPTWVHPRVAIHIAQWLSPKYAVKVTGWIMELHIRGTVTLGQEHADAENMELYKQQLTEAKEKIEALDEKCYQLEVKYAKTQQKVSYPKFTKGNCLYIWKNPDITDSDKIVYKVGIASNINTRLSTYRTGSVIIELHFLVYTDQNEELELAIKNAYSDTDPDKSNLKLKNHEFYQNNHVYPDILSELISFITGYLTLRRYKFDTEPDLARYNRFMCDLAA